MAARTEQVSWLEAANLAFPNPASGLSGWVRWRLRLLPGLSQWRGRAGFSPASEVFRPPEF